MNDGGALDIFTNTWRAIEIRSQVYSCKRSFYYESHDFFVSINSFKNTNKFASRMALFWFFLDNRFLDMEPH